MIFLKLKVKNGKLKIAVGGGTPQSIREDTRIKELRQMPEYGIDAIFAFYESKFILCSGEHGSPLQNIMVNLVC